MESQLELLSSVDWDILIIFDACRWDYWDEMYGIGKSVESPESCTRDWICTIRDEFDWSDVSCITANPVICHYGDFLKEINDVGEKSHQKVNGVPTVPPDSLTSALEAEAVLKDGRIYAHFVQPHGPYPLATPPLYFHRVRPESDEVDVDIEYKLSKTDSSLQEYIESSDSISWETVREGYRRNLEWAYSSVIDFAESCQSKVVITSDHGEYLGEHGKYGHDCDYDGDIVRVVPWYEI